MSNLINSLLPNPSLPTLDNSVVLPSIELPPEVQALLKPNMLAQLEINMAMSGGKFPANFKIDGQSFEVFVNETLLNALKINSSSEMFVSLPLRVNSSGQLQILPPEVSAKSEAIRPHISGNPLSDIQASPLKIATFIDAGLKELQVPENIRQQIVGDIAPLEISLSTKGQNLSSDNILQPLNNILKQMAARPQDIPMLKAALTQEINNLLGQEITGEVSARINDITTLKTPLGETIFSSKVKLPLQEILTVTIENQAANFSRELKFLDNLLKLVLPSADKIPSLKPELIHKQPTLQNLSVLEANIPPSAFNLAVAKLPFSGANLLENIYNFYQGVSGQDLSRWLGQTAVKEISASTDKPAQILNELNNFMTAALKETPDWRMVEMPLFDGNQFSPLKIAVKKDKEDKNKSAQKKVGTRFIVETTFSQLGDFQFDGFASASKRSFDLIIRTSKQMDEDFCTHVINLFKKSLYNLDYVGTVKINRQEAFINLQEENTVIEGMYV